MNRFFLAIALTAMMTPAAAQQTGWVRSAVAGWLGVTYDIHWVPSDAGCVGRVVVDGVARGSPAERAGVRHGDAVIAINGDRSPATTLRVLPGMLSPGDSVRLLLERDRSTREIVAIADRRPERPPLAELSTGPSAAPGSGRLPIIYVAGDRISAANVEPRGAPGRAAAREYWLVTGQDPPVTRNRPARPRNELERRIEGLLRCAAEQSRALPALVALDVGRIQERAESLRVVIARRALEHRDPEARAELIREIVAARPAELDDLSQQFLVRLGAARDAATADGVAGAQLVAMEPELAAYFQGARGLLVLRIDADSPAARSGLKPGDVITTAAGRRVASPAELHALLAAPGTRGDRRVEVTIVRQGRQQTISLPRQ